jgi:hypothetical protein
MDFDGSDMLRGAVLDRPISDVGDTFTMKMHRLGDDYLMINYVVEFEPDRRIFVAPGAGVERLHTEHSADRVQGGGHVDVQVGVDSTNDSAASFYNGHGHPFSLIGSRGGAAVP